MFKKVFLTLSLPIIMLSFIVCSKLDPYTSAGSDVINTIDPSLTDFKGNFFAYTADESIISDPTVTPDDNILNIKKQKDTIAAGFTYSKMVRVIIKDSIPESFPETIRDTTRDTLMGLAKNSSVVHKDTTSTTVRQMIQAAGNLQFSVSAKTLPDFKTTDSVTAVKFVFDTIAFVDSSDTAAFLRSNKNPGELLKLYSCSKEFQDTPFVQRTFMQRTAGATLLGSPVMTNDSAKDSAKTPIINFQLTVTDSAFLAATMQTCRRLAACNDTSIKDSAHVANCSREPDSIFYFTMFNSDMSSLLRFKGAHMIITHHRVTANDSISGIDHFSSTPGALSAVYWTKYRHTTVFKVNLLPIWESLSKSNFTEILSAAFVLPEKITHTASDSDSVALLQYYLAEVPYSADTATDAKIDNATKFYQSGRNIINRAEDTLILPVDFFLQKMSAGKPADAYLYLQTFSKFGNWQDIRLNKPRFRAVFTTIR